MAETAETSLLQCPFREGDQLHKKIDGSGGCLPGHPRIKLSDREKLYRFIYRDLWPKDLETMSNNLWWMSKQDGGNISPLHRQIVKGRKIVITEDPRLHLIWKEDRIFIKPLPQYLTSHSFWHKFLSRSSDSGDDDVNPRKAALGILRTYFYLIQYESDLRLAQDPDLSLVPKDVTWPQFCHFSANFNDITDNEVSGRYHYGEIRLTRLNYYAPILLGRTHYQRMDYQYRAYFARIQGPIICAFAFLSILLNCMQVYISAAALEGMYMSLALAKICYWFSIITAVLIFLLFLLLASTFILKIVREWRFAILNRLEWRKQESGQREKVTGNKSLHV